MQDASLPPTTARRSKYFWLAAILALSAAGWSGFWFYAARTTDSVLSGWIEREASHGRVWTCPERKTAGFPFRIEIACAKPTFAGPAGSRHVTGSLGQLRAYAQIYQPNLVLADIDGPLSIVQDDGLRVDFAWSRLRISLRGAPQTLSRLSIEGAGGALTANIAGRPLFEIQAGAFEAHVRQSPDRSDNAYDLALTLRRAVAPALDAFLNIPGTTDVDFVGTANHLVFSPTGDVAERLEIWRAGGGRLEPTSLDIRKGNLRLRLAGGVGLDAAHRPEGKLTLEGEGLQPLFKRFGVNLDMVAAGNLLDGLLGGKPKSNGDTRQGLRLPLTLDRGRLAVGPLRTPIALPPLY